MTNDNFNIKVFLRCRPLKNGEHQSALRFDTHENTVVHETQGKKFEFESVFPPDSSQEDVYMTIVKPQLHYVLKGYNATVFAYGPTGTGKTYTMEGKPNSTDEVGIIPRSVLQIFNTLRTKVGIFSVRVSFIELYNEEVYDLLSGPGDTSKLKIWEDVQRKNGVIIDGLTETTISSAAEIYDILQKGSLKRQTAATLLNVQSSRSHSIFSITILSRDSDEEAFQRIGKLNLVDLAGSENIGRSGAQNKNAREAGSINQSLLTLTRVVTALVEKRPHIPYRESKLTRILQGSLGGSTITSMIATVSPAEQDLSNTLSTIDYASRARCIMNHPEQYNSRHHQSTVPNKTCSCKDYSPEREMALAREISELEIKIRNEVADDYKREIARKDDQLQHDKERFREQCKAEVEKIKRQIEQIESESKTRVEELESENQKIKQELLDQASKNKLSLEDHEALKSQHELLKAENESLKEQLDKLKRISEELSNNSEIEQLKQELRDERERSKLVNKLYEDQTEKVLEIENENLILKEQIKLHQTRTPGKKPAAVKRVPKQAAVNENDYANLTFDGDDEIVMVSAKKKHKPLTVGAKREICNPLTLSGKKRNLPTGSGDLEISPVSPPKRLTRSRASRKKLAF